MASDDNQHDLWLTTSAVAERYGVPEATVRWWRHLGTGPKAHKFGKHVRYSEQALRDWEDQCSAVAAATFAVRKAIKDDAFAPPSEREAVEDAYRWLRTLPSSRMTKRQARAIAEQEGGRDSDELKDG